MQELIDLRTANAKHYDLGNGLRKAEVYVKPVHYKDRSGRWQDIDLTLHPDESVLPYDLTVDRSALVSRFKKASITEPIRVELGDSWMTYESVRMGFVGPDGTWQSETIVALQEAQVSGNRVMYPGAYPDIDETFIPREQELKHVLTIHSLPIHPEGTVPEKLAFHGKLRMSKGLSLWANGIEKVAEFTTPGPIEVQNQEGETVFLMPDAWAEDSAGNRLDAIYALEPEADGAWAIETHIDWDWLKDPARTFPVIIDPTTTLQPGPTDGKDAKIYAGASDANYGNYPDLWAPRDGAFREERSLIQFDMSSIPPNARVESANLSLYHHDSASSGVVASLTFYALTDEWVESQATYNQRETGVPWTTPGGDYDPDLASETVSVDNISTWYTWGIKEVAQEWIDRAAPNYGLILMGSGGHGKYFYSSDYTDDPSLRPKLELVYSLPGNILFRNPETGEYCSDAHGNVLVPLDFGAVNAGKTTEAKAIELINWVDSPVNEVELWVETQPTPDLVEVSKTNNPFISEQLPMRINGTFETGAVIATFYVRAKVDQESSGLRQITLRAKARMA